MSAAAALLTDAFIAGVWRALPKTFADIITLAADIKELASTVDRDKLTSALQIIGSGLDTVLSLTIERFQAAIKVAGDFGVVRGEILRRSDALQGLVAFARLLGQNASRQHNRFRAEKIFRVARITKEFRNLFQVLIHALFFFRNLSS